MTPKFSKLVAEQNLRKAKADCLEHPKKLLIEALAHFLVDNQAGKSIALQALRMERIREEGDPRPAFASEWSNLRLASTLQGYPTYEEAVKTLTDLLS